MFDDKNAHILVPQDCRRAGKLYQSILGASHWRLFTVGSMERVLRQWIVWRNPVLADAGTGDLGHRPEQEEEAQVDEEPDFDKLKLPDMPTEAATTAGAEAPPESEDERLLMSVTADNELMERLTNYGIPWRGVIEEIKKRLPQSRRESTDVHAMVPALLDSVFGAGGWRTEKRPSKQGQGQTTWVVGRQADEGN